MNTLLAQSQVLGTNDQLIPLLFSDQTPFVIIKFLVLAALTLYLVFGLVMIRQIGLMTDTIKSSINPGLKLIGYIHMLAAILVWLFAMALL
jgi:hypothetical protein